jgi:diguanylate cyclase (GGDEF)-like protein/PAS domain S-box-containing protein
MTATPTTVLLIEDDSTDAELIQAALAGPEHGPFQVEWVRCLAAALDRLEREPIDVVLLDLILPDGEGIEAFERVLRAAPEALILVLSTADDEETALGAVRRGAHDYLDKGHADAYWLPRALRYVTDRKATERVLRAAEETLFEEKERTRVMLDSIGDAVLASDLSGKVTYLNPMAEQMTGWSQQDALGRSLTEVFHIIDGKTRDIAANPARRAIDEDQTVGLAMNCVLIRRNGEEIMIEDSAAPIHNRDGRVSGAVIVFHDGSQSRTMTEKMSYMAHHDVLTGLPNRVLLTEHLSRAIDLAQRHRKQLALLFLDLDHFKVINDSLGHAIGDRLLQSVAERLTACVRTSDTVCRQGGDEFVILLAEIEQPQDAARVAEKVHAALGVMHAIDEHELPTALSIGISVYPNDGDNVDDLMRSADTAMFHAKTSGRNSYQFFTAEMNRRAIDRQLIESRLRRALTQGEFVLHYQPQIDLTTGKMTGAEALIRWQDPEHGFTHPEQFIPIAEACGLIVPIGQWVLREACQQVRTWLDAGLNAVPVAVNVSALEFAHPDFSIELARLLKEIGLAPDYLELEITENVLMQDTAVPTLENLRDMGIWLAIDDFGMGYSSLSYLKRFSIDTLKIDRSFVRDIVTDIDDATIVSAVIGMGKNLHRRVIAEGVETPEQLVFLRSRCCSKAQGFLFSHPLSVKDFAHLLADDNDALSRQWSSDPRPAPLFITPPRL